MKRLCAIARFEFCNRGTEETKFNTYQLTAVFVLVLPVDLVFNVERITDTLRCLPRYGVEEMLRL